jgi:hypothetical protein
VKVFRKIDERFSFKPKSRIIYTQIKVPIQVTSIPCASGKGRIRRAEEGGPRRRTMRKASKEEAVWVLRARGWKG